MLYIVVKYERTVKKKSALQQTLGFYLRWEKYSIKYNIELVNVNVYFRSKIK